MFDGIEIDGMEEFQELINKMVISEADEKKALKKALQPIAEEVERNTPQRKGHLKRSIKRQVKKEGLATVGIVRLGKFYDHFLEYGTSKQKKHVGFFERSVNQTEDEALNILIKELLK